MKRLEIKIYSNTDEAKIHNIRMDKTKIKSQIKERIRIFILQQRNKS